MTSQVIFKIDKKMKDKAMRKAQNQGLPFASVLKMATKAFVDGDLNIGLVGSEKFNARTRKEIDQALKDIKAGKNLSPRFNTVADMMKDLES